MKRISFFPVKKNFYKVNTLNWLLWSRDTFKTIRFIHAQWQCSINRNKRLMNVTKLVHRLRNELAFRIPSNEILLMNYLQTGKSINTDYYCNLLEQLNLEIREKRSCLQKQLSNLKKHGETIDFKYKLLQWWTLFSKFSSLWLVAIPASQKCMIILF